MILTKLINDTRTEILEAHVGQSFRFGNPFGSVGIITDRSYIMDATTEGFNRIELDKPNLVALGSDPTTISFINQDNLVSYLNQTQSYKVITSLNYGKSNKSSRKSFSTRGESYLVENKLYIVAKRQIEVISRSESEVRYRYETKSNSKGKPTFCLIEYSSPQELPAVLEFDTNEYLDWFLKSSVAKSASVELSEYWSPASIESEVFSIEE
ncbi:hypothetical protein LIS04_30 [Listeria phage LIS04]|nr:hypothetical protein LIS04_30 [Listeria phage LIS04]